MFALNARGTRALGVGFVVMNVSFLAGCSILDLSETPIAPEPSVSASAIAQPTFSEKSVDPVVVESIYGHHHDPGLNVEWTLASATVAPNGGVAINLYIKNLNDVALPKEAVSTAKLKVRDYTGNETEIEPLDEAGAGMPSGLDFPLGAHSKTTVSYAFNTTIGNLYSAEFQAGNVIFKGSLIG